MEGSNERPCASVSTVAAPLRTVATSECVVPRSMPTARRCWCGSGDSPGSEICRSAIRWGSSAFVDQLERVVDLLVQLFEKAQFAHERAAGSVVLLAVER